MERCLRLIVSFGIIGFAKQIVDADIVKAGKFNEDLSWNIICADFIFGISCLRHAQIIGYLLLIQIVIVSQIANALINHLLSPEDSISNLKWIIDF